MTPYPPEKNYTWLPVAAIAGGLVVWGVLLAVGAYLAPGGAEGGHDGRKLLVVAFTTGGFLLLWGAVLMLRQAKVRRKREKLGESSPKGP